MELNNNLFADLTEDEAASLNGGRFCRWVIITRRVCNYWRCVLQRFWAVRCY
jgi:hypothetical protein